MAILFAAIIAALAIVVGLCLWSSVGSVLILAGGLGLVVCAMRWYDIYNRSNCIFREWNAAKAAWRILQEKRATILANLLQVIGDFKGWNKEVIDDVAASTPSVWWLQQRFPQEIDTMSEVRGYMGQLTAIETQVNNEKIKVANFAAYLHQMKMDAFFNLCVPTFIRCEKYNSIVPADLMAQ